MRYLAIFVVSALLLLTQPVPNQDTFTLSDGRDCGLTGDATSDQGKAIDRRKNRYDTPPEDRIEKDITLAAMLAPGDDEGRFDPDAAARITGFVIDVKVGGIETCNCHAKKPIDRDTHIELALAENAPKNQRIIVEVTPRLRAQMKKKDIDWTTDGLRASFKGKWVEVTGWMLFDIMHLDAAENTNPGNTGNWRASCWEIHPISAMKVVAAPAVVASPALLAQFQGAHARQLKRDAGRRQAITKRNEAYLAKFDKEELKEREKENIP